MPLDNSELTYKIIIEDNPFLDGFYAEMKYTDYDYRHIVVPIVSNILKVLYTNSKFNTQYTEMNDTNWDGVQLNVANAPTEFTTHCDIRPFNLTCHKPHWFTVGQHVIIPSDAKGSSSFESTITKAVWTFRGGWELSCTGGDTRMLSETVKNSQAKKLQRAVLYKRKSS
jgi:hypothetical protein